VSLVCKPVQPRLDHLVLVRLDGVWVLGCWKIGGAGPAHDAAVASTTVEISLGSAQGAFEVGLCVHLSGIDHRRSWYLTTPLFVLSEVVVVQLHQISC